MIIKRELLSSGDNLTPDYDNALNDLAREIMQEERRDEDAYIRDWLTKEFGSVEEGLKHRDELVLEVICPDSITPNVYDNTYEYHIEYRMRYRSEDEPE